MRIYKRCWCKIGIVDTDVDTTHPDLQSNISTTVSGHNFVYNNNSLYRTDDHRTELAGIAGAERDNNMGISGVAPEADIIPLVYGMPQDNTMPENNDMMTSFIHAI